jgi:hypothetical protein
VVRDSTKHLGIGAAAGAAIVLVLALAWLFATPIWNWHEAKQMGKSNPKLFLVPQPLPDVVPSPSPGTKLSDFGYEFEVPWQSPTTIRKGPSLAAYIFSGGQGILFTDPPAPQGPLQLMKQVAEQGHAWLGSFLGANSEYVLLNAELNVTPDQIRPFMWKREAVRKNLLLQFKEIELLRSGPSVIYSFALSGVRGFQFGDPSRDGRIEIECFDSSDHELRLFFSLRQDSGAKFTQEEINRVLQTLHAVTPSSKDAPAAK